MPGPRVLIIDIETAPNVAHTWGLWKQTVALNQLVAPGYVLCFAAKWAGEKKVTFGRVKHNATTGLPTPESRRAMLDTLHALLDEADIVVHYNGVAFDIPRINAEFMEFGYKPPSPYKQVDLMVAIKKRAVFASHKLAYIADRLGIGSKVKHEGHGLWRAVMRDDARAWGRMKRYNEGDVRLTERLYNRILPWIPSHPNRGLYVNHDKPVCASCGSTRLQSRGLARTSVSVYPRYWCASCGAWGRGRARAAVTQVQGESG